jgi:hypothetical protein
MRHALILLVLGVSLATRLQAQDRYLTAMEYSVAVPIGDTHRFDASGSWAGANWEGRWLGWPHMSVGTLVGFNEFYQRQSGTFDFPGGAANRFFTGRALSRRGGVLLCKSPRESSQKNNKSQASRYYFSHGLGYFGLEENSKSFSRRVMLEHSRFLVGLGG